MSIETSTNNVQQFINDFEELYSGDRSVLFELLEGNTFSLQEKKAIFDGLSEWKDKAKFYNLMTSSSRTELYDYRASLKTRWCINIVEMEKEMW